MAPEGEGDQNNQVLKPEGEPMLRRKIRGYWNPIKEPRERVWVLKNGLVLKIPPTVKGYLSARAYYPEDGATVYLRDYYLTENNLVVCLTHVYPRKTTPKNDENEKLNTREKLYTEAEIVGIEDQLRLDPLEQDSKYPRAELIFDPKLPSDLMGINYLLTAPTSKSNKTRREIIID